MVRTTSPLPVFLPSTPPVPVYGPNILVSGLPIAETSYNYQYDNWMAVDGDLGTRWGNGGGYLPTWWGYDFDFYNSELIGGVASASSSYGSRLPQDAINMDPWGSVWTSNGSGDAWWQYDFGLGKGKILNRIKFYTYWDGIGSPLKDFNIEGSMNGSSWFLLGSGQAPNASTIYELSFINTTAWRYYRINLTSNWRGPDDGRGFYEVLMTGRADTRKKVNKVRILPFYDGSGGSLKNFKIQGCNDEVNWVDVYTGLGANNGSWQEFEFPNNIYYRMYRIYCLDNWRPDYFISFIEVEMMEGNPVTPPSYGPNLTTGCVATADSEDNPVYSATQGADQNDLTRWSAAGAVPFPHWLKIELAAPLVNVLIGGTPSVDDYLGGYPPQDAVDGIIGTRWNTNDLPFPHWWKYDLGIGITKTVKSIRIYQLADGGGSPLKDFILKGSNDNTNWTDIYTGQVPNGGGWYSFSFSNSTTYRYYMVHITSNWRSDGYCAIPEIEMYETVPTPLSKTVARVRILPQISYNPTEAQVRKFQIQGSHDGTNWSVLLTEKCPNTPGWKYFTVPNVSTFPYYRLYLFDSWRTDNYAGLYEFQIYELLNTLPTTFGPNFLTGGTPTALESYFSRPPVQAVDGDLNTMWSNNGTMPCWWKYDLGIGITKTVNRFRIYKYWDDLGAGCKDIVIEGSNDDSLWTTIANIQLTNEGVSGYGTVGSPWQDVVFANNTSYRYYRVTFLNNWRPDSGIALWEMQMMEGLP